jgi:hypothetical protein
LRFIWRWDAARTMRMRMKERLAWLTPVWLAPADCTVILHAITTFMMATRMIRPA